jgi:hypothetical protein
LNFKRQISLNTNAKGNGLNVLLAGRKRIVFLTKVLIQVLEVA